MDAVTVEVLVSTITVKNLRNDTLVPHVGGKSR